MVFIPNAKFGQIGFFSTKKPFLNYLFKLLVQGFLSQIDTTKTINCIKNITINRIYNFIFYKWVWNDSDIFSMVDCDRMMFFQTPFRLIQDHSTDFDQDGLGFGRDPDGSRMSHEFGARWTDEPKL